MRDDKLAVEMKGRPAIPFVYRRPETTEDCKGAFDYAKTNGLISSKLTFADVFDYGLLLKYRARIVQENTDEQGKTKRRDRAMKWVLSTTDGAAYRDQFLAVVGSTRDRNGFLDDLYDDAETAAKIETTV